MDARRITQRRISTPERTDSGSALRIDLSEGEEVVLVVSPHWLYILIDRAGVQLFVLAAAVLVWVFTVGALPKFAAVLLVVGWILWQFAERASRRYVLTSRRVVSVAGLLRQKVVDAPIGNVRQVTMYKSIPERLLGLGTLGFATAGTDGQDVIWRLIDRPGERFTEARRWIDRPAGRSTGGEEAE